MAENIVPKWQRELKSFFGIKSGIILEGNVHDEHPIFDYSVDPPSFLTVDTLGWTLLTLAPEGNTDYVFFDPVDGFYTDFQEEEEQNAFLKKLLDGYDYEENRINHGQNICYMPTGKRRSPGSSKYVSASEIICKSMLDYGGADGHNIVFILNFASRLEACNLSASDSNLMFMNLFEATTSGQSFQEQCNSLILIVDKYNDIPTWFYLNNPNIRTISISVPDRTLRTLYLHNSDYSSYEKLAETNNEAGRRFIAETEGMHLKEITQILKLAQAMKLPPDNIDIAFRLYKYGIPDNPWENLDNNILSHIETKLSDRVKGQEEALSKVKTVISRAVKGLSGLQHSEFSHKPKGILFFAGPTGVGKTETAKALAESIFGDENACIRFDMSEYRLEQSDQKLFGAPPGYVGYEGGGQLTNAVKNRPFSILLFDEIEKASPTILDKFLQILEDGRMTDNQGNTVYFGETIIIFTSNIGMTKNVVAQDNPFNTTKVPTLHIENVEEADSEQFRQEVTDTLTEGVKSYFLDIGRPELLNRLGEDNIVVFQFINKDGAEAICESKLKKICLAIRSAKKIEINTDEVLDELKRKAVLERENGGRGIGNMLEREFQNPLAIYICTLDNIPRKLKCTLDSNKRIVFEAVE